LLAGRYQLFPDVKTGPKKMHTPEETINLIIKLRRKKMLGPKEISQELIDTSNPVSTRIVERILKDSGFPKLHRKTDGSEE